MKSNSKKQHQKPILEDKYKELLVLFNKNQQRFLLDGDHSGLKLELANEFQSSLKEKKCTKEDVIDICREIESIKTKTRPFTMRDNGARAMKFLLELLEILTLYKAWKRSIYLGVPLNLMVNACEMIFSPALTIDFFDRKQKKCLLSGDCSRLKMNLANQLYSSLQEKVCTTDQVVNICKKIESMKTSRASVSEISLFRNPDMELLKHTILSPCRGIEGIFSFIKEITVASNLLKMFSNQEGVTKAVGFYLSCLSLEKAKQF